MDSCSPCLQVATANCRLNRPAALPRLSAAPREMDGDLAALREALCVSARDGRRSCGSARGHLPLRATTVSGEPARDPLLAPRARLVRRHRHTDASLALI